MYRPGCAVDDKLLTHRPGRAPCCRRLIRRHTDRAALLAAEAHDYLFLVSGIENSKPFLLPPQLALVDSAATIKLLSRHHHQLSSVLDEKIHPERTPSFRDQYFGFLKKKK
ncbi:hypothetical protein VTK56DRAFT_724 [Thermocarpiscus australiensis]